jgi:hypothetical protein
MGNQTTKIELRYKNQIQRLRIVRPTFERIKDEIFKNFKFSRSQSITLRYKDNTFISTQYKWAKKVTTKVASFSIMKQLSDSIRKDKEICLQISTSMFKVLDPTKKIICTGIQISENLCLCPLKSFKIQDFYYIFDNFIIEFFNGEVTKFKSDGFFHVLGNHESEKVFFVAELEKNSNPIRCRTYTSNKRTNGKVIYFNKAFEMLESVDFTNVKVFHKEFFNVPKLKKALPGGIVVSESGKIMGIYLSQIGSYCIPMLKIYSQISSLYKTYQDTESKKKLSQVNNIRIHLYPDSKILEDAAEIIIPSPKIDRNYISKYIK